MTEDTPITNERQDELTAPAPIASDSLIVPFIAGIGDPTEPATAEEE